MHRRASHRGWLSYRTWENAATADIFLDITLVKDGRLLFAYVRRANGRRWRSSSGRTPLRAAGAEVEVVDMARAEQAGAWLGPVA